jgi:hypothetical protein
MNQKGARSAFILAWILSIPSILGFQLTGNSPSERHQTYSANGVMTPRRSPILPSQGMARNCRLEAIWGPSSSSHPSSSKDDDDEEVEKETEKTPTEDTVVSTSMSSTDEPSDDATEPPTVSTEKSLLVLVNEIGNNFRAMAQKSTKKGYESEDQFKKILHAAKACVYYSLFIVYRTYRGFFVLLPATFRQVYGKMEAAMNTGNLSLEEIGFDESGKDVARNTSKWRTKVTVSILTSVVTISYSWRGREDGNEIYSYDCEDIRRSKIIRSCCR